MLEAKSRDNFNKSYYTKLNVLPMRELLVFQIDYSSTIAAELNIFTKFEVAVQCMHLYTCTIKCQPQQHSRYKYTSHGMVFIGFIFLLNIRKGIMTKIMNYHHMLLLICAEIAERIMIRGKDSKPFWWLLFWIWFVGVCLFIFGHNVGKNRTWIVWYPVLFIDRISDFLSIYQEYNADLWLW